MASAAGYVLSSRDEVFADRVAETATRHGWEAKVERAETQLATLGRHRPVDVIKTELASVAVAPASGGGADTAPIWCWRRAARPVPRCWVFCGS